MAIRLEFLRPSHRPMARVAAIPGNAPTDRAQSPPVGPRAFRYAATFVVALLLSGSTAHSADPPRHVLMLHAYNYTFPATTVVSEAVRKRLLEKSNEKIEIDADFLDLMRFPDEAFTANFLHTKYAHAPPAVIVTLGAAGLPFIVKHRDTIGPKTPVVFTLVSPTGYASLQLPPDVTGIISDFNLDKTLTLAETLQPDAVGLVATISLPTNEMLSVAL